MREIPLPQAAIEGKRVPDVRVSYRMFSPPEVKDPKTAIIFISGAFVEGVSSRHLMQSFANRSGLQVFGMNAEMKTRTTAEADTISKASAMAEAFPNLQEASEIERVIVVGHSKGTFEGSLMEDMLDRQGIIAQGKVDVLGGIYFAPDGLTQQLRPDIIRRAGEDFVRTTFDAALNISRNPGEVGTLIDYLLESGNGLIKNHIRGVIDECRRINHHERKRRHPVILVFGGKDPVSNLDNIVHPRYRREPDGAKRYLLDHFYSGEGKPAIDVIEIYEWHHSGPLVHPGTAAEIGWNAFSKLLEQANQSS